MTIMSNRFTVPVEEDDFGDLIITLPTEVVNDLGWYEGMDLEWSEEIDGSIVLKKSESWLEKNQRKNRVTFYGIWRGLQRAYGND